jgi:predicted anti-sigma-YlaC factor YlaD
MTRMGQMTLHTCDRVRELVSASLDGELTELEGARVQAHLASCTGCRTYAAGAAEASRLLRETPLEELGLPIVLPGRRLAVARKLQVAAAAAAFVVTVGLSAAVATISSSPRSNTRSSASASKLRFPEQELRMLERASEARSNRVVHRIAL